MLAVIMCFIWLPLAASAVTAQSSDDTVDFVLMLDCTDSMINSDTSNICEAAAKMFTDFAPSNNARVAVVAFGNTWTPAYTFKSSEMSYMSDVMGKYARTRICSTYDMVELSDVGQRGSIKQAIHNRLNEKKYSHTNTYIGGGLMAALDTLYASSSDDAAIILMSDGRLSGFDTTDNVEWKRTNRELVYDAIKIAASEKWKIYSVELNDDGKNTPNGAAKSLFSDLSSKTGGDSREITRSDMAQLVSSFIGIFGSFMNADAETIEDTISGGSCSFALNIPDATSETNIVITGGEISSVSVNGTVYSSDTYNDKAYFVKNQDGHYSLLKLFAPESGKLDLVVYGQDGANIQVQTISTCDLPVGLTFSKESPIVRNTELELNAFLANPTTGKPVNAGNFYKNNTARITVTNKTTGKSDEITPETIADGYRTTYDFTSPGDYEISVSIRSDALRGGEKSFTRRLKVENYGMEVELDGKGSDGILSRGEIVTVNSYFTGPDGKVTGDIYGKDDAELEVLCDNVSVARGIKMNASESGYSCDYTVPENGNYVFRVVSRAACLAGEPSSLSCDSSSYECGDYSLDVDWSYEYSGSSATALHDMDLIGKSSIITVNAVLLDRNGERISRNRVFSDNSAVVAFERGNEIVDTVKLSLNDTGDAFTGKWRVAKSGDITATLKLNDEIGSTDAVSFSVQNHAPVLLKNKAELSCNVGETVELNLSDYIRDDDNDILDVRSEHESGTEGADFGWKLSDDSSKIIISAGGHASDTKLIFIADDGDESVELPLRLTIKNRKPKKTADIDVPHFILNAPGFMFFIKYDKDPVSYELNEYFEDPDGLPLTYTLESKTGMAVLDGTKLNIVPSETASERLKLSVTDSSGETVAADISLTVDDWWTLNIRRFLITVAIAAVVILIIVIIVRRESNIGRLRITSVTVDGDSLELNEPLNKKRVSRYSVNISKFIRNRVVDSSRIQQIVSSDKGKIIGHLIFGHSVTIKGSNANGIYDTYGDEIVKNRKKIKLKPGSSLTLRYDNVQVTMINNN